jgi:hypothetical protein
VHLLLVVLLVAAIPGMQRCSGDFIGSCLTFLIPLLLGAALFVLIGLGRWAGGASGTLLVADSVSLLLGLFAASSGTTLVAVGATVAIVTLAAAEAKPEGPVDPHR